MAADAVIDVVRGWGRKLALDIPASRATSARLRRCTSIFEALLEPETITLIRAARAAAKEGARAPEDERLALLAIALAHRPRDGGQPFANALGRTGDGRIPGADERPRYSPLRFGALLRVLRAHDWDGSTRSVRRAFALLGDASFDVERFVADVLFLNDRTLQRWTYDYWQTPAPSDARDAAESSSPNPVESAP
jgi:CRISPR system Cascade subunit CasB